MVFTDDQLVRRCRSWSRGTPPPDRRPLLQALECPDPAYISVEEELGKRIAKYSERALSLQCQSSHGMWHDAMSEIHKCILISVAHLLGFQPGGLLLDWGSGCGHSMTWAKMLFDVDGLGVDIMAPAVEWAQVHSLGKFCTMDGRYLGWIPEDTFDYVFSYASLYHMSREDQCATGVQLVQKLRIGGKAFFGWNQYPVMNNWEWVACFQGGREGANMDARSLGIEVEIRAVEDGFLFPPDARGLEGKHTFLYQYPAYSIFITRLK